MTYLLKQTVWTLAFVLALDLLVLLVSLSQVAVEGRTGSWSPFWASQAQVVVRILN